MILTVPRDSDRNVNKSASNFIKCFKVWLIWGLTGMFGINLWANEYPAQNRTILLSQSDQVWIFGMSNKCARFTCYRYSCLLERDHLAVCWRFSDFSYSYVRSGPAYRIRSFKAWSHERRIGQRMRNECRLTISKRMTLTKEKNNTHKQRTWASIQRIKRAWNGH